MPYNLKPAYLQNDAKCGYHSEDDELYTTITDTLKGCLISTQSFEWHMFIAISFW